MDNLKQSMQAYSMTPWRKQVQMLVAFLVGLVFVAMIAGIYLNVTAQAVSRGHDVQVMQEYIDEITRTNADLETKLALLTSSSAMEARARDLGFEPVQPDQILYLKVPGYVERQPVSIAPPPGPTVVKVRTLSPEYTESLLDWFKVNVIVPAGMLVKVQP